MKDNVLQRIASGCDFTHGLTLLSQTNKHQSLIRSMAGREHHYANKLKYEFCKSIGLNYQSLCAVREKVDHQEPASAPDSNALEGKIPPEVEQVIKEHCRLFNLRAQLHQQMAGMPESNEEETVKKRKNLSDSIEIMSKSIDLLFVAKEAY